MAYNAKTNWKYNDTPTESDLNRIEQGIKDLDDSIDSHKSALTLDHPDESVTTSKLAAKSVTQDKVADKAVGSGQLADGAATDTVIGARTIDDSVAAVAGADTPTRLWSKLANMVKGITGKSNWFTPPATTLEAVNGELSAKDAVPITIRQGVNIYNVDRKSRLQNLQITGRTLVNLLGRDGNCEDASAWIDYQSTHAVSTDNFFIGTSSIKVAVSSGYTIASAVSNRSKVSLDASKYYLLAGRIKNGTATSGCFGVSGQSSTKTPVVTDTTKFGFTYKKFTGITTSSVGIEITATGAAGTYVFGDAVRLYEITKSEYDSLDTMTADQIDAKYPYVDDMKSVNALYINNPGKNMLPPFSDWTNYGTGNTVVGPYVAVITATANNFALGYSLSCAPNQTYTFSAQHNGVMALQTLDFEGNLLQSSGYKQVQQLTVTTTTNDKYIKVLLGNGPLGAGIYTLSNPMLSIGNMVLPFEPQASSYLYLPDCNLRSNVDGSVADRLYMRDGQPRVIRRFKQLILDGSLPWHVDATGGTVNVKRLYVRDGAGINSPDFTGTCIKFDGKILNTATSLSANTVDTFLMYQNGAHVIVSNAESGWGDSYSPTEDEVRAYFNGWQMGNGIDFNPYTSGTKYWRPYYKAGTSDWSEWTATLPVGASPAGYLPYRLVYQLTQSVDEPINYEGSVMLHEGLNQIELGTGIVVREVLRPTYYAGNGYYYMNNTGVNGSLMNHRTSQILRVYKNGYVDRSAVVSTDPNAYGKYHITFSSGNFDRLAAYSASYLALDMYLLGFAPQSASYTYTPNIKETVDTLVRDAVETRMQISVLQSTKAQKQQPQWIAPTLLNGWVNQDGNGVNSAAGYMKDENGFVHLKGIIKGGTQNAIAFYLPKGYRPYQVEVFVSASNTSGVGDVAGFVYVYTDGRVVVNGGTTWFDIAIPPFLAGQ